MGEVGVDYGREHFRHKSHGDTDAEKSRRIPVLGPRAQDDENLEGVSSRIDGPRCRRRGTQLTMGTMTHETDEHPADVADTLFECIPLASLFELFGHARNEDICLVSQESPALPAGHSPRPVRSTRPTPLPETTLMPIKTRLARSNKVASLSPTGLATLSTGSFSPVQDDWLIRRNEASRMRQSAGTMQPGESTTMSPGTTSRSMTVTVVLSRELSDSAPLASAGRRTLTVFVMDDCRRKTARLLRYSCQKRTTTEMKTMTSRTVIPALRTVRTHV